MTVSSSQAQLTFGFVPAVQGAKQLLMLSGPVQEQRRQFSEAWREEVQAVYDRHHQRHRNWLTQHSSLWIATEDFEQRLDEALENPVELFPGSGQPIPAYMQEAYNNTAEL